MGDATDSRSPRGRPDSRLTLPDVIRRHLGSRDVARVIYGAVIGLALVLALQEHPPAAAATAGLVVATAIAVGLAEVYSEFLGAEARARRMPTRAEVRRFAGDAAAVVAGAAFPALFFVLASLGVVELDTAFTIAIWSGLGLICGYGFLAARLTGARPAVALLHALAVGAIGGVLIALKSLLH